MDTLTRGINKERCVCVCFSARQKRSMREREREQEISRDAKFYFFGRSRSCLTEEGKCKKNLSMGIALLKASEKNYDRGCEHSLNILIIVGF